MGNYPNKIALYVTDELLAALNAEKARTGAAHAEIIRRALAQYLNLGGKKSGSR